MRSVMDSLSLSRNTMVMYGINGKTIKVQVPENTAFDIVTRQQLPEVEGTALRWTGVTEPDLVRILS